MVTTDPLTTVARIITCWFNEQTLAKATWRVESGGNTPRRTYWIAAPLYGELLRFKVTKNGTGLKCQLLNCLIGKLPRTNRTEGLAAKLRQFIEEGNKKQWLSGGQGNGND